MAAPTIRIGEEATAKRAFAWVIDWPGWSRGGKDPILAREALVAIAPRYADVATLAGLTPPSPTGDGVLDIVESVPGDASTDFGVPHAITDLDRRPADAAEAQRLANLVAAAWAYLDGVAAAAPAELRKGPRGGGRDRDKMLGHVFDADHAYAREIGVRLPPGSLEDRVAVDAERAAVLAVLREASDGTPLGGHKWPLRYAARRIAWHTLDHAWEMQDRADPGD
ncbi:MAG: hypothetical protein ACSLFN_01780 [Candidatus Limnocylindrales bacterium]